MRGHANNKSYEYLKASSQPTNMELAWAAGFLEGEGSFSYGTSSEVTATQVNSEPLAQLKRIFGGTIGFYQPKERSDYFTWKISGERAFGVALTLFTFMSDRRQEQIVKAFKLLSP